MGILGYEDHLKDANDLVTTYSETRAGFVQFALEKNREATPYIAEAKALKAEASKIKSPKELIYTTQIRPSLLTAAGISEKAERYLTDEDKKTAIEGLIENFLLPAGEDFVDELVFRYLLIRGDSLGGKMRNLAGRIAEQKITRTIIANLAISRKPFSWLEKDTFEWINGKYDDPNIELHVKGVAWWERNERRVLMYNINVPFVGGRGNNVDLCLFIGDPRNIVLSGNNQQSIHRKPDKYLALGELKGGIDPAGADEHWKTARSALDRIRKAFSDQGFSTNQFYIGAAIQESMANEIFNMLKAGSLSNAANLTVDMQLNSLCKWLISL